MKTEDINNLTESIVQSEDQPDSIIIDNTLYEKEDIKPFCTQCLKILTNKFLYDHYHNPYCSEKCLLHSKY